MNKWLAMFYNQMREYEDQAQAQAYNILYQFKNMFCNQMIEYEEMVYGGQPPVGIRTSSIYTLRVLYIRPLKTL